MTILADTPTFFSSLGLLVFAIFVSLLIGNGLTDDRVRCHKWFNYAAAAWSPAILHFSSALCIGLIGLYIAIATLVKKKATNSDTFKEETSVKKKATNADNFKEKEENYFSSYHLIQFILLIVWSIAALISPATISKDCNSTSCSSGTVNVNLSYRIFVPILTILFSSILIWNWLLIWKQKSSHYFFSFKLAELCIAAWSLSLSLLLVETIVSISYGSDVVSQYLNFSSVCENQNGSSISIVDLNEKQERYRPLVFQFCLVGLSVAISLLGKEAPKKKVTLQRRCSIKTISVSIVCFAICIALFTPLFVLRDKICTEIGMSGLGIVLIIILWVFEVWDCRESATKPSWTLTNIELHFFVLTFALGIIPVVVFSFVTNTACRELNETCNDDVPFKRELASTILYLIQASIQVGSILFLKRHADYVSQSRIYGVLGSAAMLSSLNLTWCGTDITYWSWDESELARYLEHKGNELYTNWLFILRLAVSVAAYFRYKSFQVFLKFFVTILEEYEEKKPQTGRTSPESVDSPVVNDSDEIPLTSASVRRKDYKSLQKTTP